MKSEEIVSILTDIEENIHILNDEDEFDVSFYYMRLKAELLGWHLVILGLSTIDCENEAIEWCKNSVKGKMESWCSSFIFGKKSDAALFVLFCQP